MAGLGAGRARALKSTEYRVLKTYHLAHVGGAAGVKVDARVEFLVAR